MISDVRAFFLGGALLCGGVIFYFAALRLRFHGFKENFPLTCMSTSLVPSVFYYFWCTCVFLRWRPPVGWSQVLLSCIEVDTHAASSMAVEKHFLLTCMRISLFPSLFYDIWSSCVSFLGGLLLWGGVKFCWASSRSTRGSSIGVEKHFPRTCMRISLFSSVFYDFWCSCVSFLGGVLLCGGVKCHWGASRSTCAASSRH